MTARSAAAIANPVLVPALALALLAGSACTSFYEIPIETPIQPKMDVSMFQRVLIAGFIGGGTEDVDANLETVRLLRSQLRTKSQLRVIEAEVLQLADIAKEQAKGEPAAPASPAARPTASSRSSRPRPKPTRHASATRRTSSAIRASSPTSPSGRSSAKSTRGRSSSPARCSSRRSRPPAIVPVEQEVLRPARAPPRHPASRLSGAQGLHPAAETDLHRRPHRCDALLGDAPRGDPLQRAAEHAGAVVVLRADGQADSELPEHPQHAEDPRHADARQVGGSRSAASVFRTKTPDLFTDPSRPCYSKSFVEAAMGAPEAP